MVFCLNSESCPVGTRFIYKINDETQNSKTAKVYEDSVLEWAPSGIFVKCKFTGWRPVEFFSFFEVLGKVGDNIGDNVDMCPNCVTPWKCNGPHLPVLFGREEQEFPLNFHKEETG